MSKTEYYLMRRKKRIKLRQLADYMNCSISLISRYENDERTLSEYMTKQYQNYILKGECR